MDPQAPTMATVDPHVTRAHPLISGAALLLAAAGASAQPAPITRPTLSAGSATSDVHGATAGPKGAEWSIPGGPRIVAEPGAVVRVLPTSQPLQLSPSRRVAGYTLVVKSGKVEVRVPANAPSTVVVAAPRQATAIVQSGVLRIAALADSLAMANIEGESSLSMHEGAYRPLGRGRVVVATQKSEDTRDLATAPSAVRGKRLVLVGSGGARFRGLSWDKVEGADGYRAELVEASTGALLAETRLAGPSLEPAFPAQPPGGYLLRVRALDPSGITTQSVLEVPLWVVRVELPPGAYVDTRGAYRLGVRQRVKLTGAEGLEVAAGSTFSPAGQSVGLLRDEPTVVRLRIPGTSEVAKLELVPKTVRARIEITPRNAVWPRDPVEIRVRLEDPSGEPVPSSIVATPRVRVNVEDVSLPFARRGSWLQGTLRPRSGSGPWVIRVSVEDEGTQQLGYEFAEVAAAATPNPHSSRSLRRQTASRR